MTLALHEPEQRETRRRMSEAEYLTLDEKRVEWVNGEAVYMSPASLAHGTLMIWIVSLMDRLCRKSGSGQVFPDSVTVRLNGTTSRVPDASFVSAIRLHILRDTYIDGAPDLVVEIVSSDSRVRDYNEKFREYQSAGVAEYWIIDPTYQTIDAYRLTAGAYVAVPPEAGVLRSAVLPGLALKAEWLKQNPLPAPDSLC